MKITQIKRKCNRGIRTTETIVSVKIRLLDGQEVSQVKVVVLSLSQRLQIQIVISKTQQDLRMVEILLLIPIECPQTPIKLPSDPIPTISLNRMASHLLQIVLLTII